MPAFATWRALTILVTAMAVLGPLSLIVYQSLLTAPFFDPAKQVGLGAYEFIFHDEDFWKALRNSLMISTGMTLIAVPLGSLLAFVMERTDLPGKRWIEPMLLVPSRCANQLNSACTSATAGGAASDQQQTGDRP